MEKINFSNLNFKENDYIEKNKKFLKLLEDIITGNTKKNQFNVVYENADIVYPTCYTNHGYDTVAITTKEGKCINRIPITIFSEIIGLDIDKIPYGGWLEYTDIHPELQEVISTIKRLAHCTIIKDARHIKKRTEHFLSKNKNRNNVIIKKLLQGEDLVEERKNSRNNIFRYANGCFVKIMEGFDQRELIDVKDMLNILEQSNINKIGGK